MADNKKIGNKDAYIEVLSQKGKFSQIKAKIKPKPIK